MARRTAGQASETDFLNSFIMSDLRLVAEQTAKGNIGTAFAHYLRPNEEIDTSARTDLRTELGTVLEKAAPDHVPGGRWLSSPEHALALNQQLAVNAALDIPGSGLVGVNGPPGTGKTTMLRDLIAEIVTARARQLAALSEPMNAFTEQEIRWKTGERNRVIRLWRPELTGFEMVVASANNGAVENVTDEIPAADAIAESWHDRAMEVGYFADIASALLMPKDPPPPPLSDPLAGWALVAARLGNKENRSRFSDMFWYHKPDDAGDANDWQGMLARLKEFEQSGPERIWSEATGEFDATLARVEAFREARSVVYRNITRQRRLSRDLRELDKACETAAQRIATARQQRATTIQAANQLEVDAERLACARHAEEEKAARERRDIAEQNLEHCEAEVRRIKEGRWAAADRETRSRETERLFSHLGREALGWLFIDEAGQATPQSAVGALWRTQRAVVVGDPLQLEPITSLPFSAEQGIRNELGVDEQWSPSRTSVQRLTDRLTVLGTELPDADGKTWVGVPLSVHRRCDQPMFDLVNMIAYDGLMINGTGQGAGERFATAYPTLPESKWIDIVGDNAQGHWIPDEGRYLDRILHTLAEFDFDMTEVMVVGPFRDIARQLRTRARRYPGLVAGTIHTAQGKQADVVILVLGSNPDKPGARSWAASKPNLLNVAVSRAKRRLYVIGNRKVWGTQRYFGTMARRMFGC